MAFAASIEWDVRSGGSNGNGGGFDPVSGTPGTDYSVQDSPQITYVDLVIDGTTNTKCTSAGHPFTSAHVGNVINVTSGTGFTVQRVQITSVSGSTATCDKSLGTLSSTGGHGVLGGGLLTMAQALTLAATGNTIHIQTATYTITSSQTIAANLRMRVVGYATAHNDDGTRPTITTATNSVDAFDIAVNSTLFVENVIMTSTAGTPGIGIKLTANAQAVYFRRCKLSGWLHGFSDSSLYTLDPLVFADTEITACTGDAVSLISNPILMRYCRVHDNLANGITFGQNNSHRHFLHTVVASNGGTGIYDGSPSPGFALVNCVLYNNTADGWQNNNGVPNIANNIVNHIALWQIENNIFYGNGGSTGYGINITTAGSGWPILVNRNNAFGANGSGGTHHRNNWAVGTNDVTLTGDPFTSGSTGDFSLNNTAGAGAACKAAGYQSIP